MTVETKKITTINFLGVLKELQKEEWESLGLNPPEPCQKKYLPDGREDIYDRLWAIVMNSHYGNQQFTNDSIFIYSFPYEDNDVTTWNEDIAKLFQICEKYEAIHYSFDTGMVYFDVSW